MGNFIRASGRLSVEPEITEEHLLSFWIFCNKSWPDEYKRRGEWFACPWFFDENNLLTSRAGKFAEAHIWYDYMKKFFFDFFGYEIIGNPDYKEVYPFDKELELEYEKWKGRISKLAEDEHLLINRIRCCPFITCDEEITKLHDEAEICSHLEDYKYFVKQRN